MSRPYKDGEPRKLAAFRLTQTALANIKEAADRQGVSQSDIVEDYAVGFLKWRNDAKYKVPDWAGRVAKLQKTPELLHNSENETKGNS